MFLNKKILISGGTGTWGQEFTRQILKESPEKIVIFSRNEAAQVAMKHKFCDTRLKFVLGDIRDFKAINEACEGIDYIFHTAALKHVTKCEEQPREAVKTNIYGAQNVIEAAIENEVDVCVNISTDKVCDSNCFYGKTKSIAEGFFTEANNQTMQTDFISVRSGNILGSAGSVIPIWINQIKQHNAISLTSEKMQRFFITVQNAVRYTIEAISLNNRGVVYVFRMPAFYISDLASVIIKKFGNKKTKVIDIGKMKGERHIEWLVTSEEAERAEKCKNFFIIHPIIDVRGSRRPEIFKPVNAFSMKDAPETDMKVLKGMLKQAGY